MGVRRREILHYPKQADYDAVNSKMIEFVQTFIYRYNIWTY